MNKDVNKRTLQKLAVLGITGVMRNTSQAALEATLNLQPGDLFIRRLAAKGAIRFRDSTLWKETSSDMQEN